VTIIKHYLHRQHRQLWQCVILVSSKHRIFSEHSNIFYAAVRGQSCYSIHPQLLSNVWFHILAVYYTHLNYDAKRW